MLESLSLNIETDNQLILVSVSMVTEDEVSAVVELNPGMNEVFLEFVILILLLNVYIMHNDSINYM